MFPEWILALLKDSGWPGAIIFALCTINVIQYRQNERMNTKRFDEREALMKLVRDAADAAKANSEATKERNEVTQDLADALAKLSATNERFCDRVEMQHDMVKDKLNGQTTVIDSLAGSVRVLDGVITDIRNHLNRPRISRAKRRP